MHAIGNGNGHQFHVVFVGVAQDLYHFALGTVAVVGWVGVDFYHYFLAVFGTQSALGGHKNVGGEVLIIQNDKANVTLLFHCAYKCVFATRKYCQNLGFVLGVGQALVKDGIAVVCAESFGCGHKQVALFAEQKAKATLVALEDCFAKVFAVNKIVTAVVFVVENFPLLLKVRQCILDKLSVGGRLCVQKCANLLDGEVRHFGIV